MNYTMKKIKAFTLAIIAVCFSTILFGQPTNTASDFNTTMNSQGKIYVVIAVLTVILIGIFIYLIGIDRKIRRLEDKDN
jgi:hypothetical protein